MNELINQIMINRLLAYCNNCLLLQVTFTTCIKHTLLATEKVTCFYVV